MRRFLLDPRNSFFGRIFLWFWFVALTSLAAGVMVARLAAPAADVNPASAAQSEVLGQTAERIARRSRSSEDVRKALRFLSARRGQLAFAIELETQQFVFGFPPPLRPARDIFIEQLGAPTALTITQRGSQFSGPAVFSVGNAGYALFLGKADVNVGSRTPLIATVVAVSLLCSGLLCFFLARRFSYPVSQIQHATQALAKGQFETRITTLDGRHDELGMLSRETNKMAEHLQRLFSEHHRFLADVSHELRSPLTRLQLAIGIAEETLQNGKPEQWHNLLDSLLPRIHKEAEAIETMIAQLMVLSRQQVQMHDDDVKAVAIKPLLESCIENAQFEAEIVGKTVTLHDHANSESISFKGNAEMLTGAFENILRNAVHYATQSIVVSLERTSMKASSRPALRICITDDGLGVADSALEQLFNPFYRTDTSRTRDSGGVGLGLSIAQRAIHHHGGSIVAHHAQPSGLVIEVLIPSNA